MSQALSEATLLEDVVTLPCHMQKIYLQLIAAIDHSLQKLQTRGARPDHIGENFIEGLVRKLLEQDLTQADLESFIEQEIQKQILESAELNTVS